MGAVPTPTIEVALQEFLEEQSTRLSHNRAAAYRGIIEVLQRFLEGYWPGHTQDECDRITAAGGSFCGTFCADDLLPAYGEFLGYYMTHKVIAGKETSRLAGTVTKKLAKWLVVKGYVNSAEHAIARAERAVRELPACAEAERVLAEFLETQTQKQCQDEIEDHFSITRVQPGKIWLAPLTEDPEKVGPIRIPVRVSRLIEEGWNIGGVVGRNRTVWVLLEIWNISP